MSNSRNYWSLFLAQIAKGWIFFQKVVHKDFCLFSGWKNRAAAFSGGFTIGKLGGRRAEAAELEKPSGFELLASLHSQEITERMQTCSLLRHEFMNHLQVIYGMVQTDKADSVPEYIRKISQDLTSQDLLKRIDSGLFAQLLHVIFHAAKRISLDFSVLVLTDDVWPGFAEKQEEKVLCLRILLFNLVNGLSSYPDEKRQMEMHIASDHEADRLVITFPSMNEALVTGVPSEVKQILGWSEDINLAQIWVNSLKGEFVIEELPGEQNRITLISPCNAD